MVIKWYDGLLDDEDRNDFQTEEISTTKLVFERAISLWHARKNYYALELFHILCQSLEPYVDRDDRNNYYEAIYYLFSQTKQTLQYHNATVRKMFGKCPYEILVKILEGTSQLKDEMCFKPIENCSKKLYRSDVISLQEPKEAAAYFYQDNKIENNSFQCVPDPSIKRRSDEIEIGSKKWMLLRYNLYRDKLPGFTFDEFYNSILKVLSSELSNDELQNELCEILGFDLFELISEFIENRKLSVNYKDQNSHIITNGLRSSPISLTKNDKQAPVLASQVTVKSEEEKKMAKQLRRVEKKIEKEKIKGRFQETGSVANFTEEGFPNSFETWTEKSNGLLKAANTPLFRTAASLLPHKYEHVYDEQIDINSKVMICGKISSVPFDAVRKTRDKYEEIMIPARKLTQKTLGQKVKVSSIDKFGKIVFKDIEEFNVIQSEVFETAYHTNENMLICAPTGAGKTNIALMAIVHEIKRFIINNVVQLDKFKIVYVCPMKALASEMTANFSNKLKCFGVNVKELTGDMQLTKKEILQTQMLITTPEKWDVVSRKGTVDSELTGFLKLLILDEVHLLNTDRGPVIEALVARTLRQVISSQNMIRIIGLSATLPNYVDVAHFLRVNLDVGLFYFDARFRSVPLTQTFVGIKTMMKDKTASDMDEVCFEKVVAFLKDGHQVMVFVHARNQTMRTATFLKDAAIKAKMVPLFTPKLSIRAKKITWQAASSSKIAVEDLVDYGLGIHHAGIMRKDRSNIEKLFKEGAIRVLVCTATLAWGVNLPAHGVIIKGTRLYDTKKSSYVDLDVLDVLQIFGRAGRPQFDTSGSGIIITSQEKVQHYLSALTNQIPIESNLLRSLADHLNAEVVLGTVSNLQEAVEWLTYTYLFRRMRINPLVYGLSYDEIVDDSSMRDILMKYVNTAALKLDQAQMVRYEVKSGEIKATNLGRTASYFYIGVETIETFNQMIDPFMRESDVINMMCFATEFQQIQVRQEELEDLDFLYSQYCEYPIAGGSENVHGKVNILMQTFLSNVYVKCLSLACDMEYITQSAARIARSLFDIARNQHKATFAGRCLLVSQMFEKQIWSFYTPMRQFRSIPGTVLQQIEQSNITVQDLRDMDTKQIANMVRNHRVANQLKQFAHAFPLVEVESKIQPITRGVIRVLLTVKPLFTWMDSIHGKASEPFWVWVEDPDNDTIYHAELCLLTKAVCTNDEAIDLVFTIPLVDPRPTQYLVRISSDRWMGSVTLHPLSFKDLKLPECFAPATELLQLQPLPVEALNNSAYEALYKFNHFNAVQTQMFHCLYHTNNNVLLGAPTGSGKTITAEICMLRLFNMAPELKVVYIAPLKALVRERVDDWKKRFHQSSLNKRVVEITGDVTPGSRIIDMADIIITTPEKWDGMSRGWQNRNYIRDVGLIIIDEIHLLGEDRGPVLEVIISRINFISNRTGYRPRLIGLSTSMANAGDLASWLDIGEMGLYNFKPSVRPVPLETHITGFPGKNYCPRMMSMNRPAFQAIRQHAPDSPSLIFCSSRKQTRLTAYDLINYLVNDFDPKRWLHCSDDDMNLIVSNVIDTDLKNFLPFGIAIHHAGLQNRDRNTVEELYVNQKIQVLIATATLAWGVNFPAHLVVIKGTEYYDGKKKRYVDMPITDVLQMMGRAGRPQFDTSGVACVFVHDLKKNFYKKFLYEPFPIESNLLEALPDHINAEIAAGTISTKHKLMEYLTSTFFFRRLLENPLYYNLPVIEDKSHVQEYLGNLADKVTEVLVYSNCVTVDYEDNNHGYETTFFGQLASFYYISHKTVLYFQNNLRPSHTIMELLKHLCHAEEYATFPVRHNEDKINVEFACDMGYNIKNEPHDSPQLKVSLLLYAHIFGYEFPNQEYVVDCKSALEQTIRILQAMLDITTVNGWLSSTIKLVHLMQMMIQGKSLNDDPILTIPHITRPNLSSLQKQLPRFSCLKNVNSFTLATMKITEVKERNTLKRQLLELYDGVKVDEIMQFIRHLPWLDTEVKLQNVGQQILEPLKGDMISDWEYEVEVKIRRYGPSNLNVTSSKFPKSKDEGWFLCLGDKTEDKLVWCKRLTINKFSNVSAKFSTPTLNDGHGYTLYVLSDSYMGLDQQYEVSLKPHKTTPRF